MAKVNEKLLWASASRKIPDTEMLAFAESLDGLNQTERKKHQDEFADYIIENYPCRPGYPDTEDGLIKYIAYGSNMNQEQMSLRCPEARLIGIGVIHGARLEFYLHATVEKTGDVKDEVPVAVWEINLNDRRSLDRYEDYPYYYKRDEIQVQMDDGTETEGLIYLMDRVRDQLPADEYYEGIADAYRSLGIEEKIRTVLEPALKRCRKRTGE